MDIESGEMAPNRFPSARYPAPLQKNLVVDEAAVIIRNGEKTYKCWSSEDLKILNGVNMRVPVGSIYTLLGSSGSGKSTLISCILGISALDRGTVEVFGSTLDPKGKTKLGTLGRLVGFMPQNISLSFELTVSETIRYSSILCWLTEEQEEAAIKFLADILELPECSRKVGSLSGGEQRRLSFAIALLHEPRLVILDEPTADVDAVIRQRIWEHLKYLVMFKSVTVIMTTHYVDEARQGHTVGVLRNGKLIAEASPEDLMSRVSVNTFQEAVLTLCKTDNRELEPLTSSEDMHQKLNEAVSNQFLQTTCYNRRSCVQLIERVSSLVKRNFILHRRNLS